MDKAKVSIIRCDSYEDDRVLEAVRKGIELLGGISLFVKASERILMKPNILFGSNPEKGVTTHPAVFQAVGRILESAGVDIFYGDSSGFGKSELNLRRAGIKEIGDARGYTIADFDSGRQVSHKSALLVKQFIIANGVLDCDGLISLPRFKTHGLVRFTGAVKNQFGCIPGLLKSQFHVKLPDPNDFAAMLVDINTLIKPRLYIMDGIIAMEGNGPRSGKPKNMNVLLFSTDPVALDATACRMINLDPEIVPTSRPGERSGLGTYHSENITLLGDPLESFFNPGFDVNRESVQPVSGGWLRNAIKNRITARPAINKTICTSCGICVSMCPVEPKAVNWQKNDKTKSPVHDYSRCIRCYCCQEMCPEGAIFITKPVLAKIFN